MTYAFLNVRLHVLSGLKSGLEVVASRQTEEAQEIYVNMVCVAPSGM